MPLPASFCLKDLFYLVWQQFVQLQYVIAPSFLRWMVIEYLQWPLQRHISTLSWNLLNVFFIAIKKLRAYLLTWVRSSRWSS
jgi:hypothetical protein